ncbi:conserved hypothetical protein [gamma proteobacterium HdN1]|nr:conserved hypothetical protein [gamma proteobacterium HdN1]
MSKFAVVYDACVLYPAPLRDLLLRLAVTNLFKAHWTDKIHDEWINALLRQGKFSKEKLEKIRQLMDAHIVDAKVTRYEGLIDSLSLPDPNDRHVLAAIRCNADAIITFNLKDFPPEQTHRYGVDILHPDDFIHYQLEMSPALCCSVIRKQRAALKNPPINVPDFLSILQRQQLPQTVSKLAEYMAFL